MCHACERPAPAGERSAPRRRFLELAGGLAGGLAAGLAWSRFTLAEDVKTPPKPENVISPEAALDRLMKGNARYVDGVSKRHDFKHEREALTTGQNPFAAILGCADSRVAPEYAFDTGRGDLFVCRVAGNVADDYVVASFEYAIVELGTPLLLVLGHKACGAVNAALKSIRDGTSLPGHLPEFVSSIAPAVERALQEPGDALANAITQNVLLTVEKLSHATPIIAKFVADKKLRVLGAIYNLDNGRIELVPS